MKTQTSCIIRRSFAGCSLLVSLFRTSKILVISSDALSALSQLMQMNGIAMRKNATKASEVRALMRLPAVTEHCKKELLDKVEALLVAAEESRNQPKKSI